MNHCATLNLTTRDMQALLSILDDYCDTDCEFIREANELRVPVIEAIARATYQSDLAKKLPGGPAHDVTVRTADKGYLAFEFRVPAGELGLHKLYQSLKADSRYIVALKAVV